MKALRPRIESLEQTVHQGQRQLENLVGKERRDMAEEVTTYFYYSAGDLLPLVPEREVAGLI